LFLNFLSSQSGNKGSIALQSGPNRSKPIKRLTNAPIPLIAHQPRPAEQPINSCNSAAASERECSTQSQVPTAVIIPLIGSISVPQTPEANRHCARSSPIQ
jgi:hypothetical protein